MESYRSEEEQIAALKKWWADNGNSLLIAVAVALAIVFGWKSYQASQVQEKSAASVLYQQIVTTSTASSKNKENGAEDSVAFLAKKMLKEHPDTEYALYARLFLAKDYINKNQLEDAASELNSVITEAGDDVLASVAKGRLARVLAAQGKVNEALILIENPPEEFKAQYLEIKGDLLKRQGKRDEAIEAYKTAFALVKDAPQNSPLLAVKLADLGVNIDTL